jgi:serine/threonine protein kinase
MDVETINLWKIGMLLYESAFLALPFSIEYLASVVASGKKLELKFPANSRSLAFKEFLSSILVINPEKRACPGWQKKVHHSLI